MRYEMNNPSNGIVLQRYKVQVLTAALHSFTIVAPSPAEAYQKVVGGQGGAEAGREGPTPIAVQVHPMGVVGEQPTITLQGAIEKFVVDAAAQGQARAAQGMPPASSLIQVVPE